MPIMEVFVTFDLLQKLIDAGQINLQYNLI